MPRRCAFFLLRGRGAPSSAAALPQKTSTESVRSRKIILKPVSSIFFICISSFSDHKGRSFPLMGLMPLSDRDLASVFEIKYAVLLYLVYFMILPRESKLPAFAFLW